MEGLEVVVLEKKMGIREKGGYGKGKEIEDR